MVFLIPAKEMTTMTRMDINKGRIDHTPHDLVTSA